MKKGVGILLLGLLMFSGFSFAFAATDSVDTATQSEVQAMGTNYGAKMRMLQMQFEIERRVMWMEQVVAYTQEKGEDTTELEGAVEELKLLSTEAEEVSIDDLDAAVQSYIDIKKDARDLVLEFREKANEMLNEQDRETLRLRFNEPSSAELEQLRTQVQEQRRMLNAERTEGILQRMNVSDGELVEQIRNGELIAVEVRERLKAHYQNAGEDEQLQIKERLKTAINDRKTAIQARVTTALQNYASRIAERAADRIHELQQAGSDFADARAARRANAD